MADYFDLPTINEETCNSCGACCMHIGMPPFASCDDFEFQVLPTHLKRELWSQVGKVFGPAGTQDAGKPCLWLNLETRQCRHYEHRPFCCREFRPGSDVCLDDRELCGIDNPLYEGDFS